MRQDTQNRIRGYTGVKLRRAGRSRPGYQFGGRDTVQRVHNYISANPPPVPPIEVSFLPIKVKYFSGLIDGDSYLLHLPYHQGGNTMYNFLANMRSFFQQNPKYSEDE